MSVDGDDPAYDAMGTIGGEWQYAYGLAGQIDSATRPSCGQAS